MGRKMDALLRRNFNHSKFTSLVKLAISRVAILKNQHRARYSFARSDVIELLKLGHQERALFRVDLVLKEQKMLDAFVMIEAYCYLLIERTTLIHKNTECPDELKEAISSLIFASSRCGEFPELFQIREIAASTFGSDFSARAVELRSNCGVNPKMIQKLSSHQQNSESRLKSLREVASSEGIILQSMDDGGSAIIEPKSDVEPEQQQESNKSSNYIETAETQVTENVNMDEKLYERIISRKYSDAATAAQEAFESAAYAAVAARAAVELSRSESQDKNNNNNNVPDDQNGSNNFHHIENTYDFDGSSISKVLSDDEHEAQNDTQYDDAGHEENLTEEGSNELPYRPLKWIPLIRSQGEADSVIIKHTEEKPSRSMNSFNFEEHQHSAHLSTENKGISMRTRRQLR